MIVIFGYEISPKIVYTTVAASSVAAFVTYLHATKNRFWSKQGIKGPKPLPVIGNFHEFFTSSSFLGAMEERYQKYGPVYGMYIFTTPQLVCGDPEMIKDILVRDWNVFADRTSGVKSGDPIFDNFLTALSGNEWKRMRSVMSPTFTSGKMKAMFGIMNDCSQLMVNNIRKRIREVQSKSDTFDTNDTFDTFELDMRHLSGCYSMDVIAKCCFATDTNSFDDPNQVFVTMARNFFDISKWRIFVVLIFFLFPRFIRKRLGVLGFQQESTQFFSNVAKAILEQRRRDGTSNEQLKGTSDYMQLLIEASKEKNDVNGKSDESVPDQEPVLEPVPDQESHHGNNDTKIIEDSLTKDPNQTFDLKRPLEDGEIISNSVLFLAVGYDTTASLIAMTTYLLTCNQDAQSRLYDELREAYDGKGFDYETITGLKYLDAVISETLRLLPSAPAIDRRPIEDYTFKNGIFIPKRSSIFLPVWNLHHDPKYWEDSEKFDPERFLPENRHKIIPYTYIPFGGGPRNCIGMRFALLEAKLAIANLILNLKFTPCSKTDIPLDFSKSFGLLSSTRVFVGVNERN